MRVFVIGATGALGRCVLSELLAHSHAVLGLARSQDQAALLRGWGVQAIPGDLLAPGTYQHALEGVDAVCNLASAVPPRPADRALWQMNDLILRQGTQGLLNATRRMGIRRVVQQSTDEVYLPQGATWLGEDAPLAPAPEAAAARDAEEAVLESGIPCAILRAGRYYGAGSRWTELLGQRLREGAFETVHSGEHWVSPVHLFDMAQAVRLALESESAQGIFNVCDDAPTTLRDLYGSLAATTGAALRTQPTPPRRSGWRLSNRRLREKFGFVPYCPTALGAVADLLGTSACEAT